MRVLLISHDGGLLFFRPGGNFSRKGAGGGRTGAIAGPDGGQGDFPSDTKGIAAFVGGKSPFRGAVIILLWRRKR